MEMDSCKELAGEIIPNSDIDTVILERTVTIFTAIADTARLNILLVLHKNGECCVSGLAAHLNDKPNTISMRLKKLYDAGLVNKRRHAKHMFYSLKDAHVMVMLHNAIEHAKHATHP